MTHKEQQELETLAIAAHRAGTSWRDWWIDHGHLVRAAEPLNMARRRRLRRRLLHLCLCGDGSEVLPEPDWAVSPVVEGATREVLKP